MVSTVSFGGPVLVVNCKAVILLLFLFLFLFFFSFSFSFLFSISISISISSLCSSDKFVRRVVDGCFSALDGIYRVALGAPAVRQATI